VEAEAWDRGADDRQDVADEPQHAVAVRPVVEIADKAGPVALREAGCRRHGAGDPAQQHQLVGRDMLGKHADLEIARQDGRVRLGDAAQFGGARHGEVRIGVAPGQRRLARLADEMQVGGGEHDARPRCQGADAVEEQGCVAMPVDLHEVEPAPALLQALGHRGRCRATPGDARRPAWAAPHRRRRR
jgi:hypothetical protein